MFRVVAISAVLFASACGVGASEVVTADDGTSTTDQEIRKNNPCMTVRCAAGYHCVAKGQRASCEPDRTQCRTDADCRIADNYCDGCSCDARLVSERDPVCGGTIVQCFAQPCANKVAACVSGACQAVTATSTGPQCGSTTCPSGQVCCNASCGICTPPGSACIQIACQ